MGDDALIPLKLFRSSTFSMATVLGVLVGFGMFGAMLTLPLYLQLVHGATPTESGFLMLPMILGLMIASIAQRPDHRPHRQVPDLPDPRHRSSCRPASSGSRSPPPTSPSTFMMVGDAAGRPGPRPADADPHDRQPELGRRRATSGVATSSATFFRQIGGTLGTAVLFSLLFTRIPIDLTAIFSDPATIASLKTAAADPAVQSNPANEQILKLLQDPSALAGALDGDTSFLNTSDPQLAAPFLEAFNEAAVTVFWVSFFVLAFAFVLSFFFRTPPLRKTSALQEVADENELARQAQTAGDRMGALVEPGTGSTPVQVPSTAAPPPGTSAGPPEPSGSPPPLPA